MTEAQEMLFRTPQDALVFAFNYTMQQAGRPLMDRLASPGTRPGKGLSGNDGAAQAGMIRRELEALSEIEVAVLVARFAPRSNPCSCKNPCCSGYKPNPEWTDAVRVLEQAAVALFAGHVSHYRLRRRLVEKSIGVKVELKALAKECGVAEKTVSAHWKIIKEWMRGRPMQHAKGATEAATAVDGLESAARKRVDNLLSVMPFIGAQTETA